MSGRLPPRFLWGTATAAHQVEGNNINSDCWALEQAQPSLFLEPSGDAADHYHRYDEDIGIVADLGLNAIASRSNGRGSSPRTAMSRRQRSTIIAAWWMPA